MTINITNDIVAAYKAFLDQAVDHSFDGAPIARHMTYPLRRAAAAIRAAKEPQ